MVCYTFIQPKRIKKSTFQPRTVGQDWGGGGGDSFAQNVDQTRHDFQLYDVIDTRLGLFE